MALNNFYRSEYEDKMQFIENESITSTIFKDGFNFISALYKFEDVYFCKKTQRIFLRNNSGYVNIFDNSDYVEPNYFEIINDFKNNLGLCFCSTPSNYFHLIFELLFSIFKFKNCNINNIFYKEVNIDSFNGLASKIILAPQNIGDKVYIANAYVPYYQIYFNNLNEKDQWQKIAYSSIFIRDLRSHFEFLQESGGNRKIFISRSDSSFRKLINYEEVKELLELHGYEEINMVGLSIDDQARIINSAARVVAVHGAANTNFVFANRDVKILELFNEVYAPSIFQIISEITHISYDKLSFPDTDLEEDKFKKNIFVNLELLKRYLEINL